MSESNDTPNPKLTREQRHNFLVLLISHIFTKIGDGLLNPKTTLTWLMTALAAPSFLVGLLVPIRESGSMLPQIFFSGLLRRIDQRKWAWLAGAWLQGFAVAAMVPVALLLEGAVAGGIIIALLIVFSFARSICSLTGKEILGRTIPKQRRGRLSGWQSSTSGLIVLGIGLSLGKLAGERPTLRILAALLTLAASLWLLGGLLVAWLKEKSQRSEAKEDDSVWARASLLVRDEAFRRFVIVRSLMMGSALITPYYVILAQQRAEGAIGALGYLIVATGLAQWVSSPFWGRLADRSSRQVMRWASFLAGALGALVFAMEWFSLDLMQHTWTFAAVLFISVIAHSGIRVGRKTYVVDMAGDDMRGHYVAVSNTIMGVLLLIAGALGALAGTFHPLAAIALFSFLCLAGSFFSRNLEEVTTNK